MTLSAEVLEKNPNHDGALAAALGNIHFMKVDYEEAIRYYTKADPSRFKSPANRARHFGMLGSAYVLIGQPAKALDAYQNGLSIASSHSLEKVSA